MSRRTKEERIKRLQEQMEKIKEQMKDLETKQQIEIGKTVMKEWEIEDEEIAKLVITELKEEAKRLINSIKETDAVESP